VLSIFPKIEIGSPDMGWVIAWSLVWWRREFAALKAKILNTDK
jgi:hypothetical protein